MGGDLPSKSSTGREFAQSGSLVAGTGLSGEEIVAIDAAEFAEGYRRACARFREAAADPSSRELFFPLFEALNWSVALTDNLKSLGAPVGDEHVRGLRYVRNRVHHQWARALELREARSPQVAFPSGEGPEAVWPPVGYDWFWKPLSRLPRPDPKHSDNAGRNAYRAHLAERPARLALDHLERLLGRTDAEREASVPLDRLDQKRPRTAE